jgi:hypothetical protein
VRGPKAASRPSESSEGLVVKVSKAVNKTSRYNLIPIRKAVTVPSTVAFIGPIEKMILLPPVKKILRSDVKIISTSIGLADLINAFAGI